MHIPKNHPRYHSLVLREKIAEGVKKGVVHETGMIAHGRGEAFDYLLGEKTISPSDTAACIAACYFRKACNPVISVNGNVAALAARECVELARVAGAKIEVNLFHRTEKRVRNIITFLEAHGGRSVLGEEAHERIPGLVHERAKCCKEGIYTADVVLVPLEDGDRCEALKRMQKTVITIDLNPFSRTARTADVTIVDNVVRALPNIRKYVSDRSEEMCIQWDNKRNLKECVEYICHQLSSLY